jgi:hypothetical protein
MNSNRRSELTAELSRSCEVLGAMAAGFAEGSAERKALEDAGAALNWAIIRDPAEFDDFRGRIGAPLSDSERERLIQMGISPDGS